MKIFSNLRKERGPDELEAPPLFQAKIQQHVRNPLIVVAQNIFGAKKIAGDAANTQALNLFDIGYDRLSAFSGVALPRFFGDRGYVDQRVVEDGATAVLVNTLNMLRGRQVQAFIRLRHQIADNNPQSVGSHQRFGDS